MPRCRAVATRFSGGWQIHRRANGFLELGAPVFGAKLVHAVEHPT